MAIIGAGYGDEGKGLAVDAACAERDNALAVRFNGGAQAGHTVVTPEGVRHVFHHIASGALAGAPTHLGPRFACHPMVFAEELDALGALAGAHEVSIDPRAAVTTPYDVMVNQAIESARGRKRHGSCGMGFGETIERHETGRFAMEARHLGAPDQIARRVRAVRDEYVPQRLRALGLEPLAGNLTAEAIVERFVEDARAMHARVQIAMLAQVVTASTDVVLEGAQGLGLDMDGADFPHVTRSKTGLAWAMEIAGEARLEAPEVRYVTRWYATRHGAGPLSDEIGAHERGWIEDETNIANPWQGALRVGWLDCEALGRRVEEDLKAAPERPSKVSVLVTCMDQMDMSARVREHGVLGPASPERTERAIAQAVGASASASSWGPTRSDIVPGSKTRQAMRRTQQNGHVRESARA